MSLRFRARLPEDPYPSISPAPTPANLVSSLERGEVGLDGRELPHVAWIRAWRRAWKVVAFVSIAFFLTCGWFALDTGARLAREQTREAARRALELDVGRGPCVRVHVDANATSSASSIRRAIALRGGVGANRETATIMVSPRVISASAETTRTVETLDDPRCVGKKIRRERRAGLSVGFVSLDEWPWGKRKTVSVVGDAAVCVQHYLDVMDGKIGCDVVEENGAAGHPGI